MIVKVASGRDEVELEKEIQKKLDIASNEGYRFHSSNVKFKLLIITACYFSKILELYDENYFRADFGNKKI